MRFRLRTLMIAVTILSAVFARMAYLKHCAIYHRQQAALLIPRLSASERVTVAQGKDYVAFLVSGATRLKSRVVTNGGKRSLLLESDDGPGGRPAFVVEFEANLGDWHAVVAHEIVAQRFERAILRPWTMVEDSVSEIID